MPPSAKENLPISQVSIGSFIHPPPAISERVLFNWRYPATLVVIKGFAATLDGGSVCVNDEPES